MDALTRWWEDDRARDADLRATLRNVALGKGWKPPSGEVWTADMLLPGYSAQEKPGDWQRDKAMLKRAIALKEQLTPQQRREHFRNVREMQRRSAKAREMTKAGASKEAVMSMMTMGV